MPREGDVVARKGKLTDVMGVDPVVAALLERAGLGPATSCVPARAGRRNRVWLADGVVARFLTSRDRAAMERRLLVQVAAAGLPVPEVLWFEDEPQPVLVQRRLPGRMLSDIAKPTEVTRRSVVETMRRIHAIPMPGGGFGNLTAELVGEAARLSTWFVDPVVEQVAALRNGRDFEDAVATLVAARPLLDRQAPGLVHGDLQPSNLLIGDDDEVCGVLDWEAAKSGPPAFDLGWWDWYSRAWATPWALPASDGDGHEDDEELRRLVVLRIETLARCADDRR